MMKEASAAAATEDAVKTAARTLDLFEAFAKVREPMSLTELARRIGAPISSCHALIRTLQKRGFLYELGPRGPVYPTKRMLEIITAIATYDPILKRLEPVLERLRKATGETVILGKRQGDGIIYLEVLQGGTGVSAGSKEQHFRRF